MALVAAQMAIPFIQANPEEAKNLAEIITKRTGADISTEEINAGVDFIAGSQEPPEETEETEEEQEGGKRSSFKVSNPIYILATNRKYMYFI